MPTLNKHRRVNSYEVSRQNAATEIIGLDLTGLMSDTLSTFLAAERLVNRTARRLSVSFTADELEDVRNHTLQTHPAGPNSSTALLMNVVFSAAQRMMGPQ